MSLSPQHRGDLYAAAAILILTIFPVIAVNGGNKIPPLFFAAISILIAGLVGIPRLIKDHTTILPQLKKHTTWAKLTMVILFIMVIPSILIYSVLPYSSGINLGLLLQTEVAAALLIGYFLFRSELTKYRIATIILATVGIALILYNGSFNLNLADLAIIAATIFYPIGNYFGKRLLNQLSPTSIVTFRSFFGGLILLGISLIWELDQLQNWSQLISDNLLLLLFNGIIIYYLSKVFWYKALELIDISRATLFLTIEPIGAVIFANLLLNESVTIYQLIALILITIALGLTWFEERIMLKLEETKN